MHLHLTHLVTTFARRHPLSGFVESLSVTLHLPRHMVHAPTHRVTSTNGALHSHLLPLDHGSRCLCSRARFVTAFRFFLLHL
jgi:hypothetical protein